MSEIQAFRPDTTFHEVPSIAELFSTTAQPYLYTKTYQEAEDNVAIIIHSSGTTGTYPTTLIISTSNLDRHA